MGFLNLLVVALMPVLQFLLVGLVGAFLATGYSNILTPDARQEMNKIVFYVFSPCLIFTSLAKTVTFHDLVSWWFMPVNIGITFLLGSVIGWVVVKILRPDRHLEGLVIASSSAGNLGALMLIIIPAICKEADSPFGDPGTCSSRALSLMKRTVVNHDELPISANIEEEEDGTLPLLSGGDLGGNKVMNCFGRIKETIYQILEELMSPATIGAMIGFFVGVIPWLKSLIIGSTAPLRVIQDSVALLGDGSVPCVTLILGGNVLLPAAGIGVVKAAAALGFLPQDPMFQYVLLIQFALPPAMAIGTMAQLFGVGQEECSVVFLWTYLAAAPALTIWSTIFMYSLS